ncbi:MAG: RraA family protein [Geminicoccaceae bacterium]|nr:RraA family protein [Geminicoccaceae bacterium]MCB2012493.1 RraA family protein [Geminicoccaceae bacterium]
MSLDQSLLDHLAAFDTPTICNALEVVYGERVITGFTTKPFFCAFPDMKPIVGYARTATMRAVQESVVKGAEAKAHRLAYYEYVASQPGPTIAVIQDLDPEPGVGAMWGEVNTAVHRGLGVLGCVTNGSIRDLDAVDPRFQLIAGLVGPSHAKVHVEAFNVPVNIHGMPVVHGDLIHADRHGAVTIPLDRAGELPAAIDLCVRKEEPVLKAARSGDFSLAKLRAAMGEAEDIH